MVKRYASARHPELVCCLCRRSLGAYAPALRSRFDADAAIPFLDDEQLLSEQSGAQQSAGGQGRTAAQQKLSGK